MVYHKEWMTTALIWGQHLLITSVSKMRKLIEWILDASFHHVVVISFKFGIVCCQALLQVKANLCKCNNLGGYFLHRYQKPRARTNEVSSTERKNSICLARGFDINFRCKHYYVLYNNASLLPGWRAVLWKCPCRLLGVIKSYLFIYDLILFIYYAFIIGNQRNSAAGMERLSS